MGGKGAHEREKPYGARLISEREQRPADAGGESARGSTAASRSTSSPVGDTTLDDASVMALDG